MQRPTKPQMRRTARISAVQALYQMDIGGEPSKIVIKQFREHRFGFHDEPGMIAADETFFEEIVAGVVADQEPIDQMISDHLSKKWSLKRIDKTLRALMRAGTYEIMKRPDVPALVVVDEYVSISADFFDGPEAGFVNASLEKIAKKVRAHEFGVPGAPTAS